MKEHSWTRSGMQTTCSLIDANIMYEKWLSDKVSSIHEVTERTLRNTTNIQDLATVQASLGGLQSRRSEDDLEENEEKKNLTPHNLWSLLFRDRFRQRMQHLLQDAFENACESVEKKVEERRRQLVAEEASCTDLNSRVYFIGHTWQRMLMEGQLMMFF